ncbi:unnamed protein product, partial [Larinioides sclopetarius]
ILLTTAFFNERANSYIYIVALQYFEFATGTNFLMQWLPISRSRSLMIS